MLIENQRKAIDDVHFYFLLMFWNIRYPGRIHSLFIKHHHRESILSLFVKRSYRVRKYSQLLRQTSSLRAKLILNPATHFAIHPHITAKLILNPATHFAIHPHITAKLILNPATHFTIHPHITAKLILNPATHFAINPHIILWKRIRTNNSS